MSPDNTYDMTLTTNAQILKLPKFWSDSSNWSTYQERIINHLTAKSPRLKKHLLGTVRKLVVLQEWNRSFYKPHSLAPLTDEEVEKHKEEEEAYEHKQATVCEIIYQTVDKSTFLQIKNKTSAANV